MGDISARRIKELRESKNWSLRDLEDRTKISYSVISRIESGKRPLYAQEAITFSKIFGVSSDYLLGLSNNPELNEKDEKDIAKTMEKLRRELTAGKEGNPLSFYGEPLSEEAIESVLVQLEALERQTKITNKKYIPKKYREQKKE